MLSSRVDAKLVKTEGGACTSDHLAAAAACLPDHGGGRSSTLLKEPKQTVARCIFAVASLPRSQSASRDVLMEETISIVVHCRNNCFLYPRIDKISNLLYEFFFPALTARTEFWAAYCY
jgi:hypothetical protein